MADESSFGLGFLAALYACDFIQIESHGSMISASTADILQQEVIVLKPSSVQLGTQISLLDNDYPVDEIRDDVVKLAKGFPQYLRHFKGMLSARELSSIRSGLIHTSFKIHGVKP